MVEKLKQILAKLQSEKGLVTIFAILKMDDITNRWSIILSAPWINDKNTTEVFSYVVETMKKTFTQEEANTIARIGIFSEDNHLIEGLKRYSEGTIIKDEKINGNVIHEAQILAVNVEA